MAYSSQNAKQWYDKWVHIHSVSDIYSSIRQDIIIISCNNEIIIGKIIRAIYRVFHEVLSVLNEHVLAVLKTGRSCFQVFKLETALQIRAGPSFSSTF